MAGLYGDLPQAKGLADSWATKVLQPQKKAAPLAPPPSVLRSVSGGRGRGAGGRGAGRGSAAASSEPATLAPGAASSDQPSTSASLQSVHVAAPSIFTSVQDEYDPMRPNDYEEVLKERERAKQEAIAEAERQAKLKEMEEAMERARQQEQAAASTSLNISGEDAYLRRGRIAPAGAAPAAPAVPEPMDVDGRAPGLGAGPAASPAGVAAEKSDKGMSLAQKMLMKMGWREGEGLGKERQGISTPLILQKTNARAGIIVNAEPTGNAEKRPRTGATIVGTPSRVLCLRNMVGPGEVDEELEDEVGTECTKYGTVTSVVIFEVTEPGFPSEEAVRIFVQFERQESAMKALIDLQGRFFGGRNLRGAFFPESRFDKTELAPQAGEFDS